MDRFPFFILCFGLARVMSARKLLFQQLEEFSLKNVSCTCCDMGHVLPDGTNIPCDRVLVEETVNALYGNRREFERTVQQDLKSSVRELLGSDLLIIPFQTLMIIKLR